MPFKLVFPYVLLALIAIIIWTSVTINYPEMEKYSLPVMIAISFMVVVLIRRKTSTLEGKEKKAMTRWQKKLSRFYPIKALIALVGGSAWGLAIGNGRIDTALTGLSMAFAFYILLVFIEYKREEDK